MKLIKKNVEFVFCMLFYFIFLSNFAVIFKILSVMDRKKESTVSASQVIGTAPKGPGWWEVAGQGGRGPGRAGRGQAGMSGRAGVSPPGAGVRAQPESRRDRVRAPAE